MALASDHRMRMHVDRLRLEILQLLVVWHRSERYVGASLAQRGIFMPQMLVDMNLHARQTRAKSGQRRADDRACHPRRNGEREDAAVPRRDIHHFVLRLLHVMHDQPRMRGKRAAWLGQRDAIGGSIDQDGAGLPFELAQRIADRGGRSAELLGGHSNAAEIGSGDKAAELMDFHNWASSL